jgi:hypothetical protein
MSGLRRSRSLPVTLVAVLAFALVVPAAASATRTYVTHAGFFTTGIVGGSKGFKLQFWEGSRRNFKLTVKGHHSKVSYVVRGGPVAGGRVSARLGKRGTSDLRFVPVGKAETFKPPSWCKGPPYRWQRGYLVGHFTFHGERDYTHARGHRLYAARDTWSSLRCHYASGPDYHPDKEARAWVGAWSYQRKALHFGAALFHRDARPRGRRVEFRASISDRSGRVRVEREVAVAGPEADVVFPAGPLSEAATVSPPAPFTGTATFTRTPESTFSWTGDLAVDFPGIDPVRLTGPRFGAQLCTIEGCISRDQERYFGEG